MLELLVLAFVLGGAVLALAAAVLLPLGLIGGGLALGLGAAAGILALLLRGVAWLVGGALVLALGLAAVVPLVAVGGSLVFGLLVGLAPLWLPLLLIGMLLWAARRRPGHPVVA